MKKYGLKIGDVGIEFSSIEERQKALLDFTKGSDVKINVGPGIVYILKGKVTLVYMTAIQKKLL